MPLSAVWLSPVLAMLALTATLASLLAVASRWLRVSVDPRLDAVEQLLPHANCGACGYPGCRPFAEALVAGDAQPALCSVSNAAAHARIAALLGVEVGAVVRRVARLACGGGTNVSRNLANYTGPANCSAAASVGGGSKGCRWGCLNLGDCQVSCQFEAISMSPHDLPVVDEQRCTGCGDCVNACPKNLFSLVPLDRRLFVRCRSELTSDAALAHCDVACDGCGRCAKDDPARVRMHRHLPLINLTVPHNNHQAIERCPTGAIVYLDATKGVIRGINAKPIVRQGPRAVPAWRESSSAAAEEGAK